VRVAGVMSGTSLDGIDVAVVDIAGRRVRTVTHATTPYSSAVRKKILAVSNARCATSDISRLNFELGDLYASAITATCKKHGVSQSSLELIGCHGQTIYHEGQGRIPNTLQIGEAAVIAERIGAPVVSDFRTRDIAAGGQGAPLVPLVDYLLFNSARHHRVALNIGGIANITVLERGAAEDQVIAFDTGPGNLIVDQLVAIKTRNRFRFDRDGAIAARGTIDTALLRSLLRDPYFRARPPKTAGREQYGKAFVESLIASGRPLEDLLATATAFTAASIAIAIERFAPKTEEIIASGGGIHNRQLMGQLKAFMPARRLTSSTEYGIDADAKEAIAFAVLAHRTWQHQTGSLPSATGARRAVILGKVSW
jgi:anhydro-N-acetylmuramic acid kinase